MRRWENGNQYRSKMRNTTYCNECRKRVRWRRITFTGWQMNTDNQREPYNCCEKCTERIRKTFAKEGKPSRGKGKKE